MKGKKIKMSGTLEEEPLILIFQIPTKEFSQISVQTTEMIFNKYVPGSFQAFLYIEPLRNSRQIE